jgi:hypothetical protein
MADLTDADLDAIEARLDAATPGPWEDLWFGDQITAKKSTFGDGYRADAALGWGESYANKQVPLWRSGGRIAGEDDTTIWSEAGGAFTPKDADLIAHAPADLRALLAAVRRGRAVMRLADLDPRAAPLFIEQAWGPNA